MTALRTRPGVPIAQVGTWMTATGEWECTTDQLRDAVIAQNDKSFRTPILKLGHTDPRFTDGDLMGDGQPAIGRLENLRLSSNGQQLLADLVGIPAWLDDVLESAYPSRSIECFTGVTTAQGAKYAMVVTGLALLGETPPAIETLGDIAELFGVPTEVAAYTASARVAASAPVQEGSMPTRALGQVVASASIDELCHAAEEWAEGQPMLGGDTWVRDIGTDFVVFSVWLPGGDTKLFRASWSESNGAFTFGDPERVRPTYEVVPEEKGEATAASALRGTSYDVTRSRLHHEREDTITSARGRDVVTAGAHPHKESRVPISSALAERLGVPVDADDETVLAAVEAIESKAKTPAPAEPQIQEGGTSDSQSLDLDKLVADRLEPVLASLSTATSELAELKAERARATRDSVIGNAVTAGKIRPSDRATFEAQYDAPGGAPVVTAILASIAPGTAVPVSAAGHTGGAQNELDAELDALYAALYPKAGA